MLIRWFRQYLFKRTRNTNNIVTVYQVLLFLISLFKKCSINDFFLFFYFCVECVHFKSLNTQKVFVFKQVILRYIFSFFFLLLSRN